MEEELIHLKHTLDKYDEVIDDSILKKNNLVRLYPNDSEKRLEEKLRLESEIESITNAKNNPYFARIDFKSNDTLDKCYIGKLGVSDYDNNIITVDWRASISSIYYDSNIGICSYEAPEGIINGELLLKRQYTIKNSELIDYNDVDTVSNDELLKPYLGVSANNRLKNIVSTIQSEQNKIIREKLGKNLIVQGVAGSGKTTVALHRIAYLVFNNKELYIPNDYMVIGPNKFFVNYISGILPDLDVNGVSEYTLEEVFEKYVCDKYTINNSLDKILSKNDISRYKTSLSLKEDIDKYFDKLQILPDIDFKIDDKVIISKTIINNMYNELNNNIYISIKSKIDRLILLINKYYELNKEQITSKLIKNDSSKQIIDTFKNKFNISLKKYFKILNLKINNIYIDILKEKNIDCKNLLNNYIDIEDIPALIYIRYKLIGDNIYDNYKHIVIYEAQDYGEFTFYSLNKIFKNSSFSIYGDLAQSLYSYRSINNWECLKDIFNNIEILKLDKSYRTTIEIMNEANTINRKLNLTEAIPVIRHGDNVEYTNDDLLGIINKLKDKYETISIITKTQDESNKLYSILSKDIDINLINSYNLNYDYNINILPSYLSKGLEFDSVIIIDTFDKENIIDLKLLYVSMTRALHKLYIKGIE